MIVTYVPAHWMPDTMLRVEFRTRPTGVIEHLGERIDSVRSIELDNAFYIEDGTWIESLTVSATDSFDFSSICDAISGVSIFYRSPLPTGPTGIQSERVIITAREPYPSILGLVLRNEAIPNRIVLANDQITVVSTVRDWEQFRELGDDIEHKLGTFGLESVSQIDTIGEPLDSGRLTATVLSKLSDEQLQTLETAYEMGYFDVPRRTSATDVADRIGVSQSSFSERLRRAERNLVSLLFGPSASEADE